MTTEIISGGDAIAAAVQQLLAGEVVALPTETVYGLAADALNAAAVVRIFEVKERPRFDPLIVHLPDAGWLGKVADVEEGTLVRQLTERFWPGPLTFVLPRKAIVPDVVTAGLATVAVRWSAHPLFSRIVSTFGSPVAAPSANRFGRISPTTAAHVQVELGGRIPLIVDGGSTTHGVESTIIAVRSGRIEVLRPGPISVEELETFGPVRKAAPAEARIEAPGQSRSHYAPSTPVVLTRDVRSFQPAAGQRVGALAFSCTDAPQFAQLRTLSPSGDLREAAANLFGCLRELDAAGLDLIVAEQLPETGLGTAIMDRLRRAAAEKD